MQNNYRNLSSWREQTVEVKHGVTDVDFIDTRPNMFVVQNTSENTIYIGLSNVPSLTNYEFKISPHTTCAIGRPLACTKLFIFQDTNDIFPLKLWSIYDEFNMQILANTQVEINDITVQTDGIIKGFGTNAHLPSGDNKIGKVELTSDTMSALQVMFTSLSNASNIMWNRLLSDAEQENYTNLASVMNANSNNFGKLMNKNVDDAITNLASIVEELSKTVDKILKVEQVEVKVGTVISNGFNNASITTNNAWDYWKADGNGCIKVSDFASETECNITITAEYDGSLSQKSAIVYFMLTEQSNNQLIIAMYNDNESTYPQLTKVLTGFKDVTGTTLYVKSKDVFAELAKYVATVYPPANPWDVTQGLNKAEFKSAKQMWIFTEETSQAFNAYSGAFAGMQKGVNIPSVYNGMYSVTSSTGVNICSPITTEDNPVKIMDRLEIFTNNSAYDMEIKVYYTFADYIIFNVSAGDYVSDLNIPVYNISVKCNSVSSWSGVSAQFSIYGGLF